MSWRSIGHRLASGAKHGLVKEFMDIAFPRAAPSTSLLDAFQTITERGYVIVIDGTNAVTGLVTASDLNSQLVGLTEPFLLLHEIENYVRQLLARTFSKEGLARAKDPRDESRQIESADDLSFGEYVRCLQRPENWDRMNKALDRATFTGELERVAQIRNDVMHFDPDGLDPEELEALRSFAQFMRSLSEVESS